FRTSTIGIGTPFVGGTFSAAKYLNGLKMNTNCTSRVNGLAVRWASSSQRWRAGQRPTNLTPILWELLHNLALRGFYILHTDHLNDRELYAALWERGLRDPAHLPGRNPRGGWFHDFLGSWGEDDMQLWLRYYASDEDRAKHA